MNMLGQQFDLMGPNASMLGTEGDTASGRAILASQQGGMTQMGDLLDKLRFFDKRVFRLVWAAIRQYWTAPKWVRVTDDESNVRFIGLNQPGQAPIAALEVDVIMDEGPASLTPALEQFQALTDLAQAGAPIPPDVIIEAAPNLRNKGKILERLRQAQEQAAQSQPDPMQAKQAEMQMDLQAKQIEGQMKLEFMRAEMEIKAQSRANDMAVAGQEREAKAGASDQSQAMMAETLQAITQAIQLIAQSMAAQSQPQQIEMPEDNQAFQ